MKLVQAYGSYRFSEPHCGVIPTYPAQALVCAILLSCFSKSTIHLVTIKLGLRNISVNCNSGKTDNFSVTAASSLSWCAFLEDSGAP